MELLHVYASDFPHGEVYIAGTKDGLRLLKKAIEDAIENEKSTSDEFYTNDGEGYNVLIAAVDEGTMTSYVEPYAELQRNGPGPWLIWR
jgi:hypothetical protein